MAELGTEPLTFVELDSGIKIHGYDIDYLYSNILYVKDLLLIQRKKSSAVENLASSNLD